MTERRRAAQPRALSDNERAEVLEVLHSDRFVDESPATVWATLLDEGTYLASPATMYRLLRQAHGGVIERRRQATHPPRSRPELAAEAPNDIWSWDITRLRGPGRRNFFYLYVLLDLFSRYVPGWMLATVENAQLARRLIDETVARHDLDPTGLTIHSDRGVPAAKPVAQLLATLEITRSVTRPRTPNDNPYSESQFRTMKYRPQFPASFAGIELLGVRLEGHDGVRRWLAWVFGHVDGIGFTPRVVTVDGDTFIEEFGVTGDMPDGRRLESHWAEILTYSDDLVTGLRLYFNPLDFAPAVGRLGRMIGPAANRLARRGLAPVDD